MAQKFTFTDEGEYWRASSVNYRGEKPPVDLLKGLSNNGREMNQDEAGLYAFDAMLKEEFHAPDFQLQHSFFVTMFRNKDGEFKDEIEDARKLIAKLARKNWLMTLTRFRYNPSGLDEVIHGYKTQNQLIVPVSFVGPDEQIINKKDTNPYKALLGTDNVAEINQVYKWLTGFPAYMLRFNSVYTEFDCVGGYNAGACFAGLYCSRDSASTASSLGVRVVREKIDTKSELIARTDPKTYSVDEILRESGFKDDFAPSQIKKLQEILEQKGYRIQKHLIRRGK